VETLRAELELAGLAERLIIYRFRLAMATFALFAAILSEILALALAIAAPMLPRGMFAEIAALAAMVAAMFAAAIFYVRKIYYKSTRGVLQFVEPGERERLVRRLNVAPMVAYSVPFAVFYAVHVAPLWETYAWYFALTAASAIMHLAYEKPLNRAVGRLDLRIYLVLTAAMLGFTPPLCAVAIASPGIAAAVAIMFFMASSLAASLQEIYRAEKEL